MAPVPDPHPPPSSPGGTYDVNESGIEFRHVPGGPPTPRDGTEFLSRLASSLKLNVLDRPSKDELVFELLGVDVSFANALRRIMISEVPTMALEQVYMWNNTCLIHDEVLSHRLGLVPLNVDPRLFDEYGEDVDEDGAHAATDRNTVVFKLDVTCGADKADDERTRTRTEAKLRGEGMVSGYDVAEAQRRGGGQSGGRTTTDDDDDDDEGGGDGIVGIVGIDDAEPSVANLSLADTAASAAVDAPGVAAAATRTPIDPPHRPFTRHVYARDLLWAPQGDQLSRFPLHSSGVGSGVGGGIRPIHEDILLAKLRPGQVIELEAHARKGVGKDHAKFSPVATASYRLMPHVEILKPVYDDLAEELVNWFEPGVFRCVPTTEGGHRVKAEVSNPYACTMSRNFMRNPILKESVRMTRVPDHFIFTIESVGMMEPAVIVAEALKILREKCERVSGLADDASPMDE